MGDAVLYPVPNRELRSYERQMYEAIIKFDHECKNNTERAGPIIGFPWLDKILGGIRRNRVYLIAGASSHGKTAFMLQWARQMADLNDDVYCLVITLDDAFSTVLARIIACEVGIPSDIVAAPSLARNLSVDDREQVIRKREYGVRKLLEKVDRFRVLGPESIDDDIDTIVQVAREHKVELAEAGSKRKLYLFIDKFHDIKASAIRSRDQDERYIYISDTLKNLAVVDEIPVIMTAEIKKLEGLKRPTRADIRQTVKIDYDADVEFLVYNEFAVRGENANVFCLNGRTGERQGVIEVHLCKNKINGKLAYLFYELDTDYCMLKEVPPELHKGYMSMIKVG